MTGDNSDGRSAVNNDSASYEVVIIRKVAEKKLEVRTLSSRLPHVRNARFPNR